ncbi:hypothetical protein TNCV_1944741 [Trichonephila clavipes]|nr:hypothetical protein TNCV_1944741 [Trichonephila clavipes]
MSMFLAEGYLLSHYPSCCQSHPPTTPPFGGVLRTTGLDWNRVRVWTPRAKWLNSTFDLQYHTAPSAGVMVRGAIADDTWSRLILIHEKMVAQR